MAHPKRPARKPRRPYHHGNLRRALLDEAIAIIGAEGLSDVTLREIGARLGVSRTALYRHFADKDALLAAVATEGFRALRRELVTAWEAGGRRDEAFRAMGVAYVRFAIANPSHYRVMFGGAVESDAPDPDLTAEGHGAFTALVDALAALQRDGIIRADDTVRMATYVWALVHGMAMLAIDRKLDGLGTIEQLMQFAFDRLRTGIAATVGVDLAPARSTSV
jgi:AcrR family transcriptional regulator